MKRSKPLRRRTWLRARGNNKYRSRERDMEFMGWVKRQPCVVRALAPHRFVEHLPTIGTASGPLTATPCTGRVEADHMGSRGLGQKADDNTCAPLCQSHHRERTDHSGTFRPLTRDELRAWRAAAIQYTQLAWRNR